MVGFWDPVIPNRHGKGSPRVVASPVRWMTAGWLQSALNKSSNLPIVTSKGTIWATKKKNGQILSIESGLFFIGIQK